MLTPIRQNEGSNKSERYLARLARTQFLRLWTYPALTKESGAVTQELADLTIVFGQHVILFEDKDVGWPEIEDIDQAWARYFKNTIEKAAAQLWRAERYIRNRPADIYLDSKGNEPFPYVMASADTQYHLIAIAGNSIKPAKAHFERFAPGSSGTFMFNASLSREELKKTPFVVGDIDPKRSFVHVFDTETVDRLFSELGTISDLIHYLCEKEKAVRAGLLRGAAGEEELLGFYLQERSADGYGSMAFSHHPARPEATICVPEGEWAYFEASAGYRMHSSWRERALGWNRLLANLDAAVVEGIVGEEAVTTPMHMHEAVLRACASENMFSRAHLATRWNEKFDSVPADRRSARLVPSLCVSGRLYVFLFVPWIRETISYSAYRQLRLQIMNAYATVLPFKAEGIQEAIIIATEPKGNSDVRSETVIHVAYDSEVRPDQMAAAQEFISAGQILDTVGTIRMPVISTGKAHYDGYGRNDLCPCGSGKKNKKCCDIREDPNLSVFVGLQ